MTYSQKHMMDEVKEERLVCPFDSNHSILKSRIQTHLVKCAVNNKHLNMVRCPFDTTHLFHRRELEEHISICDKRPKVINDYDEVSEVPNTNNELILEPPQEWDEEPAGGASYLDSLQEQVNPNAVRCLMLGSKGQKKKFRQAERRRKFNGIAES